MSIISRSLNVVQPEKFRVHRLLPKRDNIIKKSENILLYPHELLLLPKLLVQLPLQLFHHFPILPVKKQ